MSLGRVKGFLLLPSTLASFWLFVGFFETSPTKQKIQKIKIKDEKRKERKLGKKCMEESGTKGSVGWSLLEEGILRMWGLLWRAAFFTI